MAILLILLALLIGGTIRYSSGVKRQATLDQELIRAILLADDDGAERALRRGASARAEDWSRVPPIWRRVLNGILRRSSPGKPMSALMLVEQESGFYETLGKTLAGSRLLRIMDLLIQHGADPNSVDTMGTSLLMDAIYLDDEVLAEHVLKYGANPNFTNQDGDTALMWAAGRDQIALVKLLLSHGINPNAQNHSGQTPLMWAVGPQYSHIPTKPPSTKSDTRSLLQGHEPELGDNERVVAALLAGGANVNLQDQAGNSALAYAVQQRPWLLSMLLARGGDVNARIATDSLGFKQRYYGGGVGWVMGFGSVIQHPLHRTLLMEAAHNRDENTVRLLLSHHVDIAVKDSKGKTALQMASDPRIQALLRQAVTTRP
jgi:ankyrin repeat protein